MSQHQTLEKHPSKNSQAKRLTLVTNPSQTETQAKTTINYDAGSMTDRSDNLKEFAKELNSSVKLSRKLSIEPVKKEVLDSLVLTKKETKRKSMLDIDLLNHAPKTISKERKNSARKSRGSINFKKEKNENSLELSENNSFLNQRTYEYRNMFEENQVTENRKARNNSMYARQFREKQLQNQKRDFLLFQKRQEEIDSLRDKPEINFYSKQIFEKKSHNPIHKRAKEVMDQRNKKIDKLKNQVKEMREKTQPEETVVQNTQQYDAEKFEKWLEHKKQYREKNEEKIQKKREEKQAKVEKPSFIPAIDKKSRKIVENSKKPDLTIYDKLFKESSLKLEKLNEKIRDSTPKFTPFVNKKYPHFLFDQERTLSELKQARQRSIEVKEQEKEQKMMMTINSARLDTKPQRLYTEVPHRNITKTLESEKVTIDYDGLSEGLKLKDKPFKTVKEEKPLEKVLFTINGAKTERIYRGPNYKINVNDNSAWDQNKENQIVYCPTAKFDNFLKGFINTNSSSNLKKLNSKFETIN